MPEFKTVVKNFKRICDSYKVCEGCPLTKDGGICSRFMIEYPEKAEHIIMQWAARHPIKTNRMKFEEVFGCSIVTHEIHEAIPGQVKILNASDEEFEEWLNAEYKGAQDA